MSTFTAVDLSRLPPPALVEALNYETILAKRIAKFRELYPEFDALTDADPSMIHLQENAYLELMFRQRVNDAAKAGMLAYATGTDLDHIGARDNITRYMLDPGDPSRGIPPTFESDSDFRRRIQLAPEGFSVAGPEGAYIFHTLSADPDVLDASATSPAPGEVLVTVLARRGDGTASPALVSAVERVLTDDRIRPLTDYVKVQSARIVPFRDACLGHALIALERPHGAFGRGVVLARLCQALALGAANPDPLQSVLQQLNVLALAPRS